MLSEIQELSPLENKRYVLRNNRSGEALAIIEADTATEAKKRGAFLQSVEKLFDERIELVVEKAGAPMPLPTFLENYFKVLERQIH